jgi:hypothetical protein
MSHNRWSARGSAAETAANPPTRTKSSNSGVTKRILGELIPPPRIGSPGLRRVIRDGPKRSMAWPALAHNRLPKKARRSLAVAFLGLHIFRPAVILRRHYGSSMYECGWHWVGSDEITAILSAICSAQRTATTSSIRSSVGPRSSRVARVVSVSRQREHKARYCRFRRRCPEPPGRSRRSPWG